MVCFSSRRSHARRICITPRDMKTNTYSDTCVMTRALILHQVERALRTECARYLVPPGDALPVSHQLMRSVCVAVRGARKKERGPNGWSEKDGPWVHELLKLGGVVMGEVDAPPPRSAELEARCATLRAAEEQRVYDAMTADVTPSKNSGGVGFSPFMQDVGFGAHVLTAMGAVGAFGAGVAGALCGSHGSAPLIGAAIGVLIALAAEVALFIIRDFYLGDD